MSNPAGLKQTEEEFQAAVVEYAKLNGWLCYHTYDSRRSEPGFPDLTMTRNGRLIFAELKVKSGRLTKAQNDWMFALYDVAQHTSGKVDAVVWRPDDWDVIERTLARRP